jgi:integrase
MGRRLPRFVQAWVDRDGRSHHYFRRRGYPRTRLPGLPWSSEFMLAYQAALDSAPLPIGERLRSKAGSLSAAIAGYYGSQLFRGLTGGTPAMRRAILERFRNEHGDKPITLLPKKFVVAVLDRMEPFAARNWLKAIRHLMQYCIDQELIRVDPTLGIKLKTVRTAGHHTWTEDEIAAFEVCYPVGTKARLALALGLYTAQRRGDVICMGRQHIRDGVLSVRQQKTGAALAIPVHHELQAIIAATPIGHLTLLTTKSGKSYAGNDLSEQFRVWCNAAGLPARCVFHGLRKAALTRLADAGCTVHEIAAISGHKTLKEIERYTKAADQARLARTAMERIGDRSVKPDRSGVSKPLKQLSKKSVR